MTVVCTACLPVLPVVLFALVNSTTLSTCHCSRRTVHVHVFLLSMSLLEGFVVVQFWL